MPMPPTKSERLVTAKPDGGDGSGEVVEHRDELFLLVDAEIIGVAGGEPADFAHDAAQFFLRLVEVGQINGFDVDFKIGIAPVADQELLDGDDRLVVETVHAQKAALLFQHADHFQPSRADADFFADGRLQVKKIGGDVVPDHADGTAASASPAVRNRPSSMLKPLVVRN